MGRRPDVVPQRVVAEIARSAKIFQRFALEIDLPSAKSSTPYPLKPLEVQYRQRYYRVLLEFRPLGRRMTSPGVHNLKEHVQ